MEFFSEDCEERGERREEREGERERVSQIVYIDNSDPSICVCVCRSTVCEFEKH